MELASLRSVLTNVIMIKLGNVIIKPSIGNDLVKFYCHYVDYILLDVVKHEDVNHMLDPCTKTPFTLNKKEKCMDLVQAENTGRHTSICMFLLTFYHLPALNDL